ncbi:uncharacterized protein LOC135225724 [Macrobrachium nipponense]|uniref:uncharacterized protein LOC135225724 n=1 Tax=Macrobrachium nipponense TaxID=159736 RepID=UPI0030C80E02
MASADINQPTPIVVPAIPGAVYEDDEVPLMQVWELAMRSDSSIGRDRIKVKTILSPDKFAMQGLVMFGPHPLFYEDEASKKLRKEFVLDYLTCDVVQGDDPELKEEGGITVKNLNGKPLNFKKLQNGLIKVNNVLIRSSRTLDDDIIVHELDEVLFDHQRKIDEAVDDLIEKGSTDEDLCASDEEESRV